MASKFIFLAVVLCVVQIVQPVAVEKRDIADIPIFGPLFTGAQDAVKNVENIFQNIISQANEKVINSTGILGQLLKKVEDKIKQVVDNSVQFGNNSLLCVVGEKEKAQSITSDAGKKMVSCVEGLVKNASAIFSDIDSVNKQMLSLAGSTVQDGAGCFSQILGVFSCLINLGQTSASKGALYATAIASDSAKMISLGAKAPLTLEKCKIDSITAATAQVGQIVSEIGQCIVKVAGTS
ncbi:uncharacterized protein [Periplaneta americana]|uniref:uncharacterized protein n=1 Tax=Periplaneta americana TaxID=6978 RepID=UPI0037E7C889